MGLWLRHALYDLGWLPSYAVAAPVISIGNLVAGGTGKTPFTAKLIEALPSGAAILSRGYRSKMTQAQEVTLAQTAQEVGDEPYWLLRHTKASIWVGKDRVDSAKKALLQGASFLVLDDGFQHRRLQRDCDLVLLDATDPFGKGFFLPRGYLRDLPGRLSRAKWVIITHLEKQVDRKQLESSIRLWTRAPIMGFASCYEWTGSEQTVGAFCGIAKPHFFYEALQEVGMKVVKKLTTEDHRLPAPGDLEAFALECQQLGAEALVCTEKDFVKLPAACSLAVPVRVLKMKLECVWNQLAWEEMVNTLQNRIKNNDKRI
jgi:tetraacyldisaccharide 4'-kinase